LRAGRSLSINRLGRLAHLRNKAALRRLLAADMDIAAPAVRHPILLAQTEELIGYDEQTRTRLLVLIDQRTTVGRPDDGMP
jgi:hypothetical protein